MILEIIITIFIAIIAISAAYIAFGEDYRYNFTTDEKQEFNLMSLCIQKDITIDAMTFDNVSLNRWCSERYGSVDSAYGDKIK